MGALRAQGAPNTQEAPENAFEDLAGIAATCSPAEAVLSVAHGGTFVRRARAGHLL